MTAVVQDVSAEERFWANVNMSDGYCWTWTGYIKPNGYASFYPGGGRQVAKVYAHRFSYELHHGAIPERHCVNPYHLEAVNHRANLDRAKERRTHCKNGHSLADAYLISGNRVCRTCRRKASRAHRDRQRGI